MRLNNLRLKLNKYQAVKTSGFASKGEHSLYQHLLLREKAGEISDIKCQVQVYLTEAKILYKPDFSFTNLMNDTTEWAEFKGYETDVWRIKRRLWMHYGPGRLTVYKGNKYGPVEFEVIDPKVD